jgi:hypothetical protein
LYVILDNFSPHKRAEVTAWGTANNVELFVSGGRVFLVLGFLITAALDVSCSVARTMITQGLLP